MNLQLASYHFICRYQLTEKKFYEQLGQSQEIQNAHRGDRDGTAVVTLDSKQNVQHPRFVLSLFLLCLLIGLICLFSFGTSTHPDETPQTYPSKTADTDLSDKYSYTYIEDINLTASDNEILLMNLMKHWKPMEHLDYDITAYEVLSHYYSDVRCTKDVITAQNDEESIQFSIGWGIDAVGSYVMFPVGDSIFYDCSINGNSVDAIEFEKYFCSLIIELS